MKTAIIASLAASAAAFAPAPTGKATTSLNAAFNPEFGGEVFDPMGFGKMHEIEGAFPNMFPHPQYLEESEIKHGRMAMLAWTGVWATESGLHFPGAPVADDWTNALGVWAREDPGGFGIVLALLCIAEGEGVSHAGDNFRGVSKKVPGDMGFDWMGMTKKLSADKLDRYKTVEKKNGRAAMIAMASLFAMKSIPGSVPVMDLLGAN
jgi:light-harvesting complex I chlorophyll a/b binding protein 1